MKTANFLSLSAFIVLAGLVANVGCSTPAVGDLDDSSSAESEGDDDDDDSTTTKKKSTKTTSNDEDTTAPTNTADDTTTDDTTTDPGTGGDACTTCLSANAKAVKFDDCAINCQDQACADKCMTTSGCGADQACQSTLQECDSACQGGEDPGTDPGTDPGQGGDECFTCLGSSKATGYIECIDQQQCQDQQCDDQCFDQACAGSEQSCDSKLQQCEQQCFGG